MSARDVVLIVDDDTASREAVTSLVIEMNVEARAYESAEALLDAYDGARPACLVTDVRLLRMSGLELQEELIRRGHRIATVVLTAYADTPVTVRAIKNGAVTLIEKPCKDLELWDAIREALAVDRANYQADLTRLATQKKLASLTSAERDVLDLIIAGEANKTIAHKLDISIRTVEVRRQAVFTKLGADSVAELVRLVLSAATR